MDYINNFVLRYRQNRKMLLAIVYVAIFLDNMLLTTVVSLFCFFFENKNNAKFRHEKF